MCGLTTPLLAELDEQSGRSKRKYSDQSKCEHDILKPNSCHPWREGKDKDGGYYVASKCDTNHSVCDDLLELSAEKVK